jgi:hypothetical protein
MPFEILYREIMDSTEMIRALLAGVSQEEARARPSADAWSILEVICHLYDEEREDFREHLDFILHRQDEEWQVIDPQGWVAERKYNEQDFNETKGEFFAERGKSLEWLKKQGGTDLKKAYKSQWGEMTAGDMLASWAAHDNLHVRQLVELRRARIEKIAAPHSIEYAGEW